MIRTSALVAKTSRVESPHNLSGATVVALPPSDADDAVGTMRLYVNGVETTRQYDPAIEVP